MSWLEAELRQQPEALRQLLERQVGAAQAAARLFHRRDVRFLLIASRGSSSNVARYAQYLLGRARWFALSVVLPVRSPVHRLESDATENRRSRKGFYEKINPAVSGLLRPLLVGWTTRTALASPTRSPAAGEGLSAA